MHPEEPLVGLYVPADDEQPLREVNLSKSDLENSIKQLLGASSLRRGQLKAKGKGKFANVCVYGDNEAYKTKGVNNRATAVLDIHHKAFVKKYKISGDAIIADFELYSDSEDGRCKCENVSVARFNDMLRPIQLLEEFPETYQPQNFKVRNPRGWIEEYATVRFRNIDKSYELNVYSETARGHQVDAILKVFPQKVFSSEFHQRLSDAKDEALFKALLYCKHHEDDIDKYLASPPPLTPPPPATEPTPSGCDWGLIKDDEETSDGEENADKISPEAMKEIMVTLRKQVDALNTTLMDDGHKGWVPINVEEGHVAFKVYQEGAEPLKPNSKLTIHYCVYFPNMDGYDSTRKRGKPIIIQTEADEFGKVRIIQAPLRCMEVAIPFMKEYEKAYVVCTQEYAYGAIGDGVIPDASRAIVDIEIIEVEGPRLVVKGPEQSSVDRIKQVIDKRKLAKEAFGDGQFKKALTLYNASIALLAPKFFENTTEEQQADELRVTVNMNIAVVTLKLAAATSDSTLFRAAIDACNAVLASQPDHDKALYSRFKGHLALRSLDDAEADIQRALKLNPNDTNVRAGVLELRKAKTDQAMIASKVMSLSISSKAEAKKAPTQSTPTQPAETAELEGLVKAVEATKIAESVESSEPLETAQAAEDAETVITLAPSESSRPAAGQPATDGWD